RQTMPSREKRSDTLSTVSNSAILSVQSCHSSPSAPLSFSDFVNPLQLSLASWHSSSSLFML
ncbi:hypothetical protein PMAYCL1PPCAC_32112, partial [Pristionchus mayeri]